MGDSVESLAEVELDNIYGSPFIYLKGVFPDGEDISDLIRQKLCLTEQPCGGCRD